jgi:hypothetical protein
MVAQPKESGSGEMIQSYAGGWVESAEPPIERLVVDSGGLCRQFRQH